jgi:tetratricopeptide (TPR) repeat protein
LSGDKITLGLIFNNLAYITEFSGDHISALGYAEQAIRFFEDLGANRQLAMCYSTMGKIYVYVGNYQKGLEYYQQSFDMFQKQNDLEFLGLVYSQISRALLELGQLDEARKNGEKGVELCQSYSLQNLPQALHRLGRVYERMGYLDLAIDCYKRGQKVSEEQLNSRYLMEHTTYLSHVYYKLWCLSDNPTKKEEYIKLIQSSIGIFDREASKGAYTYPMDYLLGRIKILLGNIQYDLKNYAAAIQIYKLAYYHIIIGSSETYTVDELNKFSDRLEKLPGQVALNWVQELESYWKEMNILESKPQALNFCKKQKISAMLASYVSKPKDK